MSFWAPQFCLACDKQTDGEGDAYCSQTCRLADYEKTSSTTSSGASSPALGGPAQEWTLSSKPSSSPRFYLSPAYDFSTPQSASAKMTPSYSSEGNRSPTHFVLSPSTSHTSLCSIHSHSSSSTSAESSQLSEKATRELRAYARSFESVRLQRRRSY